MGKGSSYSLGPSAQNGGGQGNSGPVQVFHNREFCDCSWCLQGHR